MIPLSEAQARIQRDIFVLDSVEVPVRDAAGLVLAQRVASPENIPPFPNTAMDGFAVRATDTVGASESRPNALRIAGTIAAGAVAERPLESGEAMRIMTGAPMPDGADAVIMVELTEVDAADETVLVKAEVEVGNHIRHPGDDVVAGTEVFAPGVPLTAGHLGVLAGLGLETVRVYRRPKVGVMSTGDELIEGPKPLKPGQIRDSNRVTLLTLVAEAGCEAVDLGLQPDDKDTIRDAIVRGVGECDVLLSSGGVSMGDFDFVKEVLTELGDFNWMQVAIKPAKPLAFGMMNGTPVFGLPGNPVSSMVSFELFARPALRTMMGHTNLHRPRISARATSPLGRWSDGKTHFQRVVVTNNDDGQWTVSSAGGQGSHQLTAMAAANALAVLPDGDGASEGDTVTVMYLG